MSTNIKEQTVRKTKAKLMRIIRGYAKSDKMKGTTTRIDLNLESLEVKVQRLIANWEEYLSIIQKLLIYTQ